MNRRDFICSTAALLSAPTALAPPSTPTVRAAFDYLYGPWEFTRAVTRGVRPMQAGGPLRYNQVNHRRTLSDHTSRNVTAPNNDTLYSAAYLELSGGPLDLVTPSDTTRYFNIAFMDLFTDNFFHIGTRATGGRGGRWWIVGPGWRGRVPNEATLVRSPSNDVWMLARTLVDGPEDLPAANVLQDGMRLSAPAGRGPVLPISVTPSDPLTAENLLAVVNAMLERSRPLQGQARRARQFARLGVRPGVDSAFAVLSPDLQAAWAGEVSAAPERLRARFTAGQIVVNGWATPATELGDFGVNDTLRAAVALGGIAALNRNEAMYFSSFSDSEGRPLDGTHAYRMRVPANVPVDAFWSMTMYQAEPDGRFFFAENPIRRYSIGDRTRGLIRNSDGSLDIHLQSRPPEDPRALANWLPSPVNGPWRASFRAYLPKPAMKAGQWTPPPLFRL